jgi:hypothetical protein
MRKLSPLKAITHALNSVYTYRHVAVRIGIVWIPVLFVMGLVELYIGPPDPTSPALTLPVLVQFVSGLVTIIAVCSMAVSWHRFILRDEMGPLVRLDGHVFRYAGNTLLIMLMVLAPALILVVAVAVSPALGSFLAVPFVLLFGGVVTSLSIKLPAVALGRQDFTFRDAWNAREDNFWQVLGVFLLSAAIFFGIVLLVIMITSLVNTISPVAAQLIGLGAGAVIQLVYTIFNASIFTSLYGFFVERRDF